MSEDILHCSSPLLQGKFSGKIIKRYNKSCLVEITDYDAVDAYMVTNTLLGKVVLSNKLIKKKK
ncbi:hypothetical protein Q9Q_01048 [Enterococcus faecalis EnGen0078]|jgi:uncharacterized membrane-anchored protein YitT (DUF2179 family)|nr:hypothetical protein [Enterococcus faecalis]EOE09558.1 hypothetical protein Q9Q_01048 [Enterococcus faecalis EnGen0078]EOK34591.1 hypothetical protein WU9_00448 [Enterococcus faecalis EnGen0334]KII50409.1 hypothetical protein QH72_01795 [Enterococcus faecalis]